MLPVFEEFKKTYDNLTVGKGTHGLNRQIEYAMSTIRVFEDAALQGKEYSGMEMTIIASAKVMGAEPKNVYNLMSMGIVQRFEPNLHKVPPYILHEFMSGMIKELYKGSEAQKFDMIFEDNK